MTNPCCGGCRRFLSSGHVLSLPTGEESVAGRDARDCIAAGKRLHHSTQRLACLGELGADLLAKKVDGNQVAFPLNVPKGPAVARGRALYGGTDGMDGSLGV